MRRKPVRTGKGESPVDGLKEKKSTKMAERKLIRGRGERNKRGGRTEDVAEGGNTSEGRKNVNKVTFQEAKGKKKSYKKGGRG